MAYDQDGLWILTDIVRLADLQANGMLLQFLAPEDQTPAKCRAAVQQNGWSLQLVRPDLRTRGIVTYAITQNPFCIALVPNDVRMATLAVQLNPASVTNVRLLRKVQRRNARLLARTLRPTLDVLVEQLEQRDTSDT